MTLGRKINLLKSKLIGVRIHLSEVKATTMTTVKLESKSRVIRQINQTNRAIL